MPHLARKILDMISLLHERGYTDIYIYSGMSPSGLNWRFSIGRSENGMWPSASDEIVFESVRKEGAVEWCKNPVDAETLCESFIEFYDLKKPKFSVLNKAYVKWFEGVQKMLEIDDLLVFYADYDAPHEYLLKFAPGYRK